MIAHPAVDVQNVSTLLSALFTPARIQRGVDRRFSGCWGDALLTVATCRAGMRDWVALGDITAELRQSVVETQPSVHVSLWPRK